MRSLLVVLAALCLAYVIGDPQAGPDRPDTRTPAGPPTNGTGRSYVPGAVAADQGGLYGTPPRSPSTAGFLGAGYGAGLTAQLGYQHGHQAAASYQSGYMAGLSSALNPGFGGGLPGVSTSVGTSFDAATMFSFEQYLQFQVSFSYVNGFISQQMPWIGFSRQNVNDNALFYPRYGLFQARVPGIYYFSFSAVSDDRDPFRIALVRGFPRGVPVVHALGDDRGYHATSQSAIVYLGRGDFCYLNLDRGRIYESTHANRHYTSFAGTLLTPDYRQLTLKGRASVGGRSGEGDLPSLPSAIANAVPATEGLEIRDV